MSLQVGELYATLGLDADKFNAGLASAGARLEGLVPIIGKISGVVAGVATASAALAPVIAGAVGLSASFAAAGVGAVAFGAVATSSLKGVFDASTKVDQIQQKIDNASSAKERIKAEKELAAVYDGMSKSQRGALNDLSKFKAWWGDFVKEFNTPVFDAFSKSLTLIKNIMTGLAPTITNVGAVVNELLGELNGFGEDGGFKSFFDWLAGSASEAMYSFAHIAGNTLQGFFNLLMAFDPVGASMEEGLLSLTEKFRDWSASLSQSKGFQTFMDYVKANTPVLMTILGNVFKVAGNLIRILAPLGAALLQALGPITTVISNVVSALASKLGNVASSADKFKAAFAGVGSFISANFQAMWSVVGPVLAVLGSKVMEVIGGLVAKLSQAKPTFDLLRSAFTQIMTVAISCFQSMWNTISPVLDLILAKVMEVVGLIVSWWKTNGAELLANVQIVFNGIMAVINFIMPVILMIITSIFENIKGVVSGALNIISGVFAIFAGLFTGDWGKMWDGVKQLVSGALQFIWNFFQLMMVGKLVASVKAGVTGMLSNIRVFASNAKDFFVNLGTNLKTLVMDMVRGIINYFKGMGDNIATIWAWLRQTGSNIFSAIFNTIMSIIRNLAADMVSGIKTAVSTVANAFTSMGSTIASIASRAWASVKGMVSDIGSSLKGLAKSALSWGRDIMGGLLNGIVEGAKKVLAKAKEVAGGIAKTVKSALGIHSPSRVMAELGQYTSEGLAVGMQNSIGMVTKAAGKMAQAATPKMSAFKGGGAWAKYFNAILEDGDWMNDWITHLGLDKGQMGAVMDIGKQFASMTKLTTTPAVAAPTPATVATAQGVTINLYGDNYYSDDMDIERVADQLGREVDRKLRLKGGKS